MRNYLTKMKSGRYLLSSIRVEARFWLVLLIGFAVIVGISADSMIRLHSILIQDRQDEVRHLLESGYSVLTHFQQLELEGKLTRDQAQEAARSAVRDMHYGEHNYFFIWDLNGKSIAHGGNIHYEGRTFIGTPDSVQEPVVSYMVSQLLAVASSPQHEGYSRYQIPKAGSTVPLDKIAYSKLFVPWQWSIGTGAYVDDINTSFRNRVVTRARTVLILLILAGLVTYLIGNDVAAATRRLSRNVERIARGELDRDVPGVERADELGDMARAVLVLRDTSREVVELRHDPLTGLAMRKLLNDHLNLTRFQSARNGYYNGLILIDMDRFKLLNDTHGHDAGDLLLKEVARRLTHNTRKGDTVARLGGDEFVVIAVDLATDEATALRSLEHIGQKLVRVLGEVYQLGSISHVSHASIGITLFRDESMAGDELLKQADLALYKAKQDGRNTFRFFDPDLESKIRRRNQMERELHSAIAMGQMELHYQPQVDDRGNIIGAEALVRWRHPERGMISPAQFIPMAEETGLIVPIGEWVLEEACDQLVNWSQRPDMNHLVVAVNVSAKQMFDEQFVEKVRNIVLCSGANPAHLKLELTESVLVKNIGEVKAKMDQLKQFGMAFSLDDFGTGYASLTYLKQLPFDQIKMDGSFVVDVLKDERSAAIARLMIDLARVLKLEVVAEGIETVEQHACLRGMGCSIFQGYLFSKPVRPDMFFQHLDGFRQAGAAQG